MGSFMATGDNFYQDVDSTSGDYHAKILDGGKSLSLTLDKTSGSGFRSKREYLFGRIDMELKPFWRLAAGLSLIIYLLKDHIMTRLTSSSWGTQVANHILSTLMCTLKGRGTGSNSFTYGSTQPKNFTPILLYGILNASCKIYFDDRISFLVDNIPIREYNNEEAIGVPFPSKHLMRVYSSLWGLRPMGNRGGLVKTNWSSAPFTAYYRNFNANACVSSLGSNEESLEMDLLFPHHFDPIRCFLP
ncbi:hypothetical protein Pint_10106 [Pistacia integerrima]|uniref:Uncharacterized protein n=1 Tax=Pistacia integerrima TaxID=434235 RepID=A0ACC0XKJ8_9ROSI|nr:hypothetical protein Pint_10106 [Pistacia integerrima]